MEQGYEKRLLGSPYKSPSGNHSLRLFGANSSSLDVPTSEPDITSPQSMSHAYNSNTDQGWRMGSNGTAGAQNGRASARDPSTSTENHGYDLLAALVANELAESSNGGTFSPNKMDQEHTSGPSAVLAQKENNNIFSYKIRKDSAEKLKTSPYSMSPVSEKSQSLLKFPQKQTRRISRVPYKVLDAPELQDDFYLNLVDWSSQNVLAVGLGSCVYLWNAFTSQVTRLCDVSAESDVISSVAWSKKGGHLAIGTYRGHVQLWDVTKSACVRSLNGHIARVGALAWNTDLLASGSRDRYILLRDTRASANSGGGPSAPLPSNPRPPVSSTMPSLDHHLGDRSTAMDTTPVSNATAMDMDMSSDEFLPAEQQTTIGGADAAGDITLADSTMTPATGGGGGGRTLPYEAAFARALGINSRVDSFSSREHESEQSLSGAVRVLKDHRQEVCGLKWSPDSQYLASGGNDNRLLVWSQHGPSNSPVLTYEEHVAAVKAIAWSPHQHGLLASGGGTADRCIRFWNTLTGQALRSVDTGSQVCNIAWSIHSNELVSTHGYSQNQILVWRYPTLTQLVKLTGHSYRVLYLAISPDGENIVTGAGDETLRFWNIFTKAKLPKRPPSQLNLFNGIR